MKTTLFDNVYGNLAFTLDIFYNQKRIFTKDVEIITLPYLDIPLEVEHTRSGRAQYAENYLKNILGTESVSCEIDDTYEDNALRLNIFVENNLPVSGEIFWKGRRAISITVDNFSFL